ncbi:glycosyl transferase family 2 [Shewanella halifaxensis HAW-EB4]|uniref:Glycosyl transferase family 2 n=1 Tax=Shewanella halifaxensis (strain HAW-EB4) TaxID=458817 RepID=B0TMJ1_SHEHH|nr:glycosyltransferase family 2 protein [Shewanella halifaxensis]ABZ76060.1 glycosyl transferase family 2 [Shewanella halifaxensis HAW-EB4]
MHSSNSGFDISVVVPLFNKEKFVERALNSILQQTILPNKIIIVDDGSTDGSNEIALRIKKRFGDLIYIHKQTNAGVSVARNKGLELADSKFVAFLDADDEFHSNFIEKAKALIEDYPSNVIYGFGYQRFGEDSSKNHIRGEVDFFKLYCERNQCPLSASSVVIDKESVGNNLFPVGYGMGEDILAWLKILAKGHSLILDSTPVAIYHHDDLSSAVLNPVAKNEPCFLKSNIMQQFNGTYYKRFIRYHTSDYIKSHILYGNRCFVFKYILRKGGYYLKFLPLLLIPKKIIIYKVSKNNLK